MLDKNDQYVVYTDWGYLKELQNSNLNKTQEPYLKPEYTRRLGEAVILTHHQAEKLIEFLTDLVGFSFTIVPRRQPLYNLKLKDDFMPFLGRRYLMKRPNHFGYEFAPEFVYDTNNIDENDKLFTSKQINQLKEKYDMSMFSIVETDKEVK